MPQTFAHGPILHAEDEPNGVLFVLFIPSKDKLGNHLPDQEIWVNAAANLLTEIFQGSTTMPAAKGNWYNEETKEIITEVVVLIHSYARLSDANNENKILTLAKFLHRLGKETNQGEIGIVIEDVFYRIRNYSLAE